MMSHPESRLKVVIVGNGIAGSTAGRYIRKYSNHDITMISGESEFPFARTALMYIYMGHMTYAHTKMYEDEFWDKNRISRIHSWVEHIDEKNKTLTLKDGQIISWDKLIIATGSNSNTFGWPGQNLIGVQGLYHLQDLDNMEKITQKGIKRAVIVGGGLIGIEMAEMFASRGIPVTMLVRERSFWNMVLPEEESAMVNKHISAHGIDLILNEELEEIIGEDGFVSGVICKHSGKKITCEFVGLTVGVHPNIELLKSTDIQTKKGVLVNDYLETSIKNIYAVGDCAELLHVEVGRRSTEAVWYTGRKMGKTVAKTICGEATKYTQGVWYNSAKFFDIEYQVYGDVPTQLPAQIQTLYWQHPKENKAIRILYNKKTKVVTGFNLMGIRYRQEVCVGWIKQNKTIGEVLQYLSLANFDPEFFTQYESEIITLYNLQEGTNISLRSNRKWSFMSGLQKLKKIF